MHIFVIAEIGACHDQSLTKACHLIRVAKDCGADAAKFQFWSSSARMAQRRHAPEYEAVYEGCRVPLPWLAALKKYCDHVGIEFMCSTYLPEDLSHVAPLVDRLKVASFEAADDELLQDHARWLQKGKQVIVSLGMGASFNKVIDAFMRELGGEHAFTVGDRLKFLHCVSAYPAPVGDLNLVRLLGDGIDGFSDHSAPDHTWTGALAVAAGASIVERHLRSDDTLQTNPDYGHAMNPRAFDSYVRHIRFAETALGEARGGPAPSEAAMLRYRVNS